MKLNVFFIFFVLLSFCNKHMSFGSSSVPEGDILRKESGRKKEVFEGFSDIFSNNDSYAYAERETRDFFSLHFGREIFNVIFNYKDLFNSLKNSLKELLTKEKVRKLLPGMEEEFDSKEVFYYQYIHRFFKSPGRFFLDCLTFFVFFKRAFFGMDTLAEYSSYLKKKFFFTIEMGWEYKDYTFDYGKDIVKTNYKVKPDGKYVFADMNVEKAVELCGGEEPFESEKKKIDLKYCNSVADIQKKNEKLASKIHIFEKSKNFVFVSLYNYFFSFGVTYYNNIHNPAESTFFFRFLFKIGFLYNVTDIKYVNVKERGVIEDFSVGDVLNKYISTPSLLCKFCFCFGYKNWEVEISIPLFNKNKSEEECTGMFYSENLQKRLPLSISLRNRFIVL